MISSIQANLSKVLGQLAPLGPVQLVAVSKMKSVADIKEAYDAGQRHFGENYVAELVDKAHQLPEDIQWHFIGHLQSNKARMLIDGGVNLYMIESVDSLKLANKLESVLSSSNRRVKILVEVHTSEEDTKSGVSPLSAPNLVNHILKTCPHLEFFGLMTIADPKCPETSFQKLSDLKKALEKTGLPVPILSMGMSDDYAAAIAYGSNQVRIGSSIFGSRYYCNLYI